MASRTQSLTLTYVAWDTSANNGKTGDVANHTLRWVKDGTSSAPTNAASEVDATNAPGVYKITMTGTECTADVGVLAGKSSTANVSIIPITITFEQLPTAVAGATGGVFIAGTNAATSIATALTANITGNITGNLSGSVGSTTVVSDKTGYSLTQTFPSNFADLAITVTTGRVTIGTNADKSGYSLTQAFPSNFADLSISATTGLVDITQTAADKAWSTAARFLTAGTNIALAKGTGVTGFNDLDAAGVATATWNAATATYGSAGSYGLLIETDLDATISSRSTYAGGAVASVTGAVTVGTNNDKTGYELSTAGVDSILDDVVEGTLTFRQIIRIMLASLAGKSAGGGTATITFKGVDGTTTRITATVDGSGDRTAITIDGA